MLITDVRYGEPNLLTGREHETLNLRSLDGRPLASVPATVLWTHESLVAAVSAEQEVIDAAGGADFYLGEQFIGSTEI